MFAENSVLIEIQYLPPVSYMQLFKSFERVYIEIHENYQKNSFRNRCIIAASSGPQILSIPLKHGKNCQQNIKEVKIANETAWQRHAWKAIKTAYGSAPYWIFYADKIESHYLKKYNFLFDFNLSLLQTVLDLFKKEVKAEISFTDQFIDKNKLPQQSTLLDYRNTITPKNYSIAAVNKYPQVFSGRTGFIPNLSILDTLFCTGSI